MGQKVLVTAGAAGIRLEIVKAFAAQKATVFVCDINEAALKELAQNVPGVNQHLRCLETKRRRKHGNGRG